MDTEKRQIHRFKKGDKFHEHYRLKELIGSGGFADVWLAHDELVDTTVALKIYTRLDSDGISELAKEYKNMRGIKHPNLLTGNHFDANGNIPYLEMDYCDGGSLYNKIGKLSDVELLKVTREMASGLAYLHNEGIVHQDIKPENILYDTRHNRYLLSDFGISSKSRTRMSKSVNMANVEESMTKAYAPPEKFSSKPMDRMPDPKGDIFSLGITLYELATGYLPFEQPINTGDRMLEKQGNVSIYMDDIKEPKLRDVIAHCLSYRKEDRPTANGIMELLGASHPDSGQKSAGSDSASLKKEKPKTVKINFSKQEYSFAKNVPPRERIITNPPREQIITAQSQPKSNSKTRRRWVLVVVAGLIVLIASVLLTRQCENKVNYDTSLSTVHLDGDDIVCTVDGQEYRYRMVYVSGGTYTMGCTGEQGSDCWGDEKPAHSVTVSGFRIGQTEVTQALWKAVMGSEPTYYGGWTNEYGRGGNYPAYRVSYPDCKEFISKLNSLTGLTFRLPTEAEWEYAARGGNSSRGYKYSGSDNLGSVAWYNDNSSSQTHPVAQKQANELGLYDMSGNVWEWCSDWYGIDYYFDSPSTNPKNPKGPSSGSDRVLRGGSWGYLAGHCRVSCRKYDPPSCRFNNFGFRLAR